MAKVSLTVFKNRLRAAAWREVRATAREGARPEAIRAEYERRAGALLQGLLRVRAAPLSGAEELEEFVGAAVAESADASSRARRVRARARARDGGA